jgi:ribosomal protein S18 acetylase RimI-like enzyme
MMQLFYSSESLFIQMKEKQHQFIVALINNEPIAFASYGEMGEAGVYKLHKIYVQPALQGKSVGKRIIDYILKHIETYKGTALELNVNRNNAAKQFYEKLGFSVVREEDIDIGNGYYMNDYVMRKTLLVSELP